MSKPFDPSLVTSTTPLQLSRAVELAFPGGGMTESGLRLEIARGRLEVEIIAGKQLVMLTGIEKMRELCRVLPKAPQTSGERPAPASIVTTSAALDAARAKFRLLREEIPTTPSRSMPAKRGTRIKPTERL